MNLKITITIVVLALVDNTLSTRRIIRSVELDTEQDKDGLKEKRDLETEGTMVDPYAYEGIVHPGGYGVPYPPGAGIIGPVLPHGHFGGLGPLGHIGAPLIKSGGGYGGGYAQSGINEGGLALGNQGQQILQQQVGGGFSDGSYQNGGQFKDGGYGGAEIYKDNRHHLADNNVNRGFYTGVQGGSKDLGNGEIFDRNQKYSQNGLNQVGNEAAKGFKKGHHKTGFRKSYHKDESGNDESFYDSDHDEGNHAVGNKFGDYYDSNGINSLKGAQKNNQFAQHKNGQYGEQDLGKLIAQNQGVRDYYGRNNFYNNANGYGQQGGGGGSKFGKIGGQHGYLGEFNNGRNYEALQGNRFGGGFGSPYY